MERVWPLDRDHYLCIAPNERYQTILGWLVEHYGEPDVIAEVEQTEAWRTYEGFALRDLMPVETLAALSRPR